MSQSPADFLRALDRAATPGPWKVHYYSDDYFSIGGQEVPDPKKRRESAEAIVALRNLLPALADSEEASEFKVNTRYNPKSKYGGEWVMVPLDDFLKLHEVKARLAAAVAAVEKA